MLEADPAALARIRELGGAELISRLVGLYLENTPKRLAAALGGEQAGDWKSVERAAHSMKSSAGNLGLTGFQHLAHELERVAEARKAEEAHPILERLQQEYPAVKAYLEDAVRT